MTETFEGFPEWLDCTPAEAGVAVGGLLACASRNFTEDMAVIVVTGMTVLDTVAVAWVLGLCTQDGLIRVIETDVRTLDLTDEGRTTFEELAGATGTIG